MCTTNLEECKKELSYLTQENIIPISLEILKKTTKKVRTGPVWTGAENLVHTGI
jgi:hypothetical protein